MYFPYLRGRQFELIALRELIEQSCIETYKIQESESEIGKLVLGKNVGDEFIWNDGKGNSVQYKVLELCN